ncbi:ABC transporter permease [Halogeometricum limi]|uniref:Putative ABC transport system permease protein n=1 Tax=Halogeometricum limi TaxID=555875 RepID=A0A1I6ILB6_9EURY|nr:ABC transporter permease [Halogeometricum limi]SFR67532.1 putative ABC transport system permease protein [Halogeometricum limi]
MTLSTADGRARLPTVRLARRNLSRNRVRTALAALGIVIGVFAIAALGILGSVLELTAADSIGSLGDQLVVTPNADAGVQSLTDRDVQAIRRAAVGAEVVPLVSGGALASNGDRQTFATLYGVDDPSVLFEAGEGELPTRHRRGAIVGSGVADELGLSVGRSVSIEGREYRVVAVLAESESISVVQPDGAVVLPRDAFVQRDYSQVVVRAETGAAATETAAAIRETLNVRDERVSIFELSVVTSQVDRFFDLLNAFLLGIGAISLVVAGVAILNVMLMSVNERREEIGVLRAVGVQRDDVLRTILVEAGLLGVTGGAVGVALAVAGTTALYLAVPEVTLSVVLDARNAGFLVLAFGFGVGVSLLSGFYPAWRAASRPPVDALRRG